MKQLNIPFKLYGDTSEGKLFLSHTCNMCNCKILDISQKNIIISRQVKPYVKYYFCDHCLKKDYLSYIEDYNHKLVTGISITEEKERMEGILNLFIK